MEATQANINSILWNSLPVPVERRCCDSERIRQALTRAFAALTVLSAAMAIYAALYFTALPLSGLAILTTALVITTIALSSMKPSPDDAEVLLQQRQTLGAEIQKTPNLSAGEIRTFCPNPKSLTKEELNLLLRHDAQTMEYTAFVNKHGHVLDILDAENLATLKPKFIQASIKKEGSAPKQILEMSESLTLCVQKEDLTALLSPQVRELSNYKELFLHGLDKLSSFEAIDLWYLRPLFIEFLIDYCVNEKHMGLVEIIDTPQSKLFKIKKEEIGPYVAIVQMQLLRAKKGKFEDFKFELIEFVINRSDTIYLQLRYLEFVPTLKCGLLEYEARKEELRVMGPKIVQMMRENILSKEKFNFLSGKCDYFALKSRNGLSHIRTMFADRPELVKQAREQFFNQPSYNFSFVLLNPGYAEDRAFLGIKTKDVKEALDQHWKKSIMDDFDGFMASAGKEKDFSPRAWTQQVLKETKGLDVTEIALHHPELFTTGILIASDVLEKEDSELVLPEDEEVKGLTIRDRLAAEIKDFDGFEEVLASVPEVLFEMDIVNRGNPHLLSLVEDFVPSNPSIYLYATKTNKASILIDKFHLMSDKLADYVKIMHTKYEEARDVNEWAMKHEEALFQKKLQEALQVKTSTLAQFPKEADISAKEADELSTNNAYHAAMENRKKLEAFTLQKDLPSFDTEIPALKAMILKWEKQIEMAEKLDIAVLQKELASLQKQKESLQEIADKRLQIQEKLKDNPHGVGTPAFSQKKAEVQKKFSVFKAAPVQMTANPHKELFEKLIAAEMNFYRLEKELKKLPDTSPQILEIQTKMSELEQKLAAASDLLKLEAEWSKLKGMLGTTQQKLEQMLTYVQMASAMSMQKAEQTYLDSKAQIEKDYESAIAKLKTGYTAALKELKRDFLILPV